MYVHEQSHIQAVCVWSSVSYGSLVSRSVHTQLLLWPSQPLSSPACLNSPVLGRLVFTSYTGIAYTHVNQRVFPLKTSAATSAELTKISSTVSDHSKEASSTEGSEDRGNDSLKKMSSNGGQSPDESLRNDKMAAGGAGRESGGGQVRSTECQPCGEYRCVLTDMPKFLVTYSPKVHV